MEELHISKYLHKAGSILGNQVKKGIKLGIESTKTLRPLSKKDALRFVKVSKLLEASDAKIVARYIKQGKCELKFSKLGLSFLVAADDLQPVLESDLEVVKKINILLTEKFQSELQKSFRERAWQITQEYIGANILGIRNIKKVLTLLLFSEKIKINFNKIPKEDVKTLKEALKQLRVDLKVRFDNKSENFDFIFEAEAFNSNHFTEMAEKIIAGKKYKPNNEDIEFIKGYIIAARKLKPELPPMLADKVKNFAVKLKKSEKKLAYKVTEGTIEGLMSFLKASARVELREEIQTKDLERVFEVLDAK